MNTGGDSYCWLACVKQRHENDLFKLNKLNSCAVISKTFANLLLSAFLHLLYMYCTPAMWKIQSEHCEEQRCFLRESTNWPRSPGDTYSKYRVWHVVCDVMSYFWRLFFMSYSVYQLYRSTTILYMNVTLALYIFKLYPGTLVCLLMTETQQSSFISWSEPVSLWHTGFLVVWIPHMRHRSQYIFNEDSQCPICKYCISSFPSFFLLCWWYIS